MGAAARVQHQHRHPGVGQQLRPAPGRPPAADCSSWPGPRTPGTRASPAAAPTAPRTAPGPASPTRAGRQRLVIEPGAVPVEMHHLIRLTPVPRRLQHPGQLGEGRRAQHIQLAAPPAPARLSRTRWLATDRNGTSTRPARPADHQQHPQPLRRPRHRHLGRGLGQGAHERPRPHRDHPAGRRVPQQLPRDPRRALGPGGHLHPGPGQVCRHRIPYPHRVPAGLEYLAEQVLAQRRQPRLHVAGDVRRGIDRVLQVILQIPADILPVPVTQPEPHPRRRRPPRTRALQRQIHHTPPALSPDRQP